MFFWLLRQRWSWSRALVRADDKDSTVYMDTKDGRITIQLRPDLAPNHVAQIKS